MRTALRRGGLVGMLGAFGFVAVIVTLHFVQPDYDGLHQLMSELALGPFGWATLPAFGCLALSLLGVQYGLGWLGTSLVPRVLLIAAAGSMLAAGVFPVGRMTALHGAIVTLGSALIVVAMYLLPSRAGRLQSARLQAESWALAGGTVVSAATAIGGVPIGVAQRLAAACVVGWLCLLSWKLVSAEHRVHIPAS